MSYSASIRGEYNKIAFAAIEGKLTPTISDVFSNDQTELFWALDEEIGRLQAPLS